MDHVILTKIEEFFNQFELISVKEGTIIVQANDEPAGVMYITQGAIEQYYLLPSGDKVTVNIFKPPAFMPMSWAINRTPNEYFFAAISDTSYRLADVDRVIDFIRSQPDITFNLLSRVYRGTDALQRRLVVSSGGVAASRIILELIIEARRFGKLTDSDKFLVKVKQHSLASRTGLARETVSREIRRLHEDGLVEITKLGMVVDIVGLERKLLSQM